MVKKSDTTSGELDVDGEKIVYTFRRAYQMPQSKEWNSTIEADYNGVHIGNFKRPQHRDGTII